MHGVAFIDFTAPLREEWRSKLIYLPYYLDAMQYDTRLIQKIKLTQP